MAYLHAHTRDLFKLVAESNFPEGEIKARARQLALASIDFVIGDLEWLETCQAVERALFKGKNDLLQKIDRLTRGGG